MNTKISKTIITLLALSTIATNVKAAGDYPLETSVEITRDDNQEYHEMFEVEIMETAVVGGGHQTLIQGTSPDNLPMSLSESNLFNPSGLSISQFDSILLGTALEGMGETIWNIEQEHNINGLLLLSVARSESGLGSSQMAKTKNNLFGMRASSGYLSYASRKESMEAFASLMNRGYANMTLNQIAKKYCPFNVAHWTKLMNGSYAIFRAKLIAN